MLGIFQQFKLYFIGAAVVAVIAAFTITYTKGYKNGQAHVQGKWDRAVIAGIEAGNKARTDAERDIRPDAPDSELCRDAANRDGC